MISRHAGPRSSRLRGGKRKVHCGRIPFYFRLEWSRRGGVELERLTSRGNCGRARGQTGAPAHAGVQKGRGRRRVGGLASRRLELAGKDAGYRKGARNAIGERMGVPMIRPALEYTNS